MKKVRTSDEIQSEINRLEWELKELREELYASNAINNPSYDEYKNKWVFYDAYENGDTNGMMKITFYLHIILILNGIGT